jgi:hypothetical protein
MVLVCLEREDITAARRFIGMMTDAEARELRLRFIAPSLLLEPHDNVALRVAFLRSFPDFEPHSARASKPLSPPCGRFLVTFRRADILRGGN